MVDGILLFSLVYAESWTRRGREKSLEHLKNLLRISTDSVDSCCNSVLAELNRTLSLTCWSLPLVTLTSIAIAIPLAEGDKIKSQLLHGVAEGLKYVRIIDKKVDSETMVNNRKAIDIVWQGVDLGHQWLKVDLAALARKEKEAKKVIELLAEEGKSFATEFMGTANGLEWSPKALARYSMHKICETILSDFNTDDANMLFERLRALISDTLVACVINLPRTLFLDWHSGSIEAKEEHVREAACLLGEVENLLEALEREGVLSQCKYADRWHSFLLNLSTLPDPSSIGNVGSDDQDVIEIE